MANKKPTAAIVTIGTEIIIGQITDTNSQFVAQKLFQRGFDIQKIVSISDAPARIKETIKELMGLDIVILTGGLGPTNDDLTKNVLCEMYGSRLEMNDEVLSDIAELVKRRNPSAGINERNRQQALVPNPGKFFRNKVGTAPGLIFDHREDMPVLIALPGVPFEMQWIWENGVEFFLQQHFNTRPQTFDQFFVSGISEADLAIKLQPWEQTLPPEWQPAYLPSPGIIRLRMFRPHDNLPLYTQKITELKSILGNLLTGEGNLTPETLVANQLSAKNLTLSTAESCTGGKLAHMITSVPGASKFFQGSVVAYSNAIKINILKVPATLIEQHGAVSCQVAEQMAKNAQKLFGTDIAVATTGIAGPTGGTPEKPVGTVWIALAVKDQIFSQRFVFSTLREVNITRTCNTALALLLEKIREF